MDTGLLIEKAINKISNVYGFDVADIEKAISGSVCPQDLSKLVDEGIYCFRGPDDEVKYENASLCLSNKILATTGVATTLLPIIFSKVRQWDREDANELLFLLRQAVSIMELNPDSYAGQISCCIDMDNLPSEDIPADLIGKYGIWAMDKKGMCLVGVDADQIMHVDDIRKFLMIL
jgi:hypothetical protein